MYANTATFTPMISFVAISGSRLIVWRMRTVPFGRSARMHSKHCDPTAAWVRQSGHAGRPQRVHARPVSRS